MSKNEIIISFILLFKANCDQNSAGRAVEHTQTANSY